MELDHGSCVFSDASSCSNMAPASPASSEGGEDGQPRNGGEADPSFLRSKLAFLLAMAGRVFNTAASTNICLLQAWLPAHAASAPCDARPCAPGPCSGSGGAGAGKPCLLPPAYRADPELALIGENALAAFRASSLRCSDYGCLSMPGRAFSGGCVHVVQDVRVLPSCVHPRSRLSAPAPLPTATGSGAAAAAGQPRALDCVGGALYLPVFDLAHPGEARPAAVLEVLLARRGSDGMVVANTLSFLGSQMAAMQLSLSSPLPQPVRPSTLAGRRPRPPADLSDSEDEEEEDARRGWAHAGRRAPLAAAAAARSPALKRAAPAAAPACLHPGMGAVPAARTAAAPPAPAPAPPAPACSAACSVDSCALLSAALGPACGTRCGAAAAAATAITAPAGYGWGACRQSGADKDGAGADADEDDDAAGPRAPKRPRRACESEGAIRRAPSVRCSLADMLACEGACGGGVADCRMRSAHSEPL